MPQHLQYKICLIGDSLSGGGAEKVHALLSDFFSSRGIKVYHVIVTDDVSYPYSGQLLNLGKFKNKSNGLFNKLYRLKTLRNFLKTENFDFIIDSRVKNKSWQEWITARLIYKTPTVYMVHSAESDYYFPRHATLARSIHKNAYGIVAVSSGMRDKLDKQYKLRSIAIPNPVDIESINEQMTSEVPIKSDFILAVGRMNDDVKQYDKLIEAYSQSVLPSKGIQLVILGDGILKSSLIDFAVKKGVGDSVIFEGFVQNPFAYMSKARFTVLSSRSEGFANVIVESLACGTPVISFDCDFGPGEIISHRHNGLLVDNQNIVQLAEAINEFVENDALYSHCKTNAKSGAAPYAIDLIGQRWLKFLNIDVS